MPANKRTDIPKDAWQNVETIPAKHKASYGAYKAAIGDANDKRAKFEADFLADARAKGLVAKGQTIVFSHKFGRLAVAIVADTLAARSTTKARTFKL